MTVERLAVAVLLCAGLDAPVTGAEEPVMPLSVAVPPSGSAPAASEDEPATAVDPVSEPAGEPGAGPDSTAEPGRVPPADEEYIPLDLPSGEGDDRVAADPADADPADTRASALEPAAQGQKENPSSIAGSYFVHAEIFGIPNSEGIISASLCTQQNFTKSGCRTERVAAHEGQVSVVFDNVAPGRYAVQVHHDQNANGKMDYTFFGLPKEPYGFSRDAKPMLAPPKFKSASFAVVDSDVSLVIHLQNT